MGVVTMKRFLVLAVALLIGSSVFAASTNFTASATFAGSADFTFQLKNVSGDSNATELKWTSADAFVMGSTIAWVRADQYAVVAATITKANASVKMYTKNKTAFPSLKPNYNKWSGSTGVAGTETYGALVRLVNGQVPSDFVGAYRGYIPVFYSLVPTKNASLKFNGTDVATEARADRALVDQANGEYGNGNYATIASLNGPVFFVKDTAGADVQFPSPQVQNNTAYMYFFGGFKDVIGGDTYSTTVYVEQSWQ